MNHVRNVLVPPPANFPARREREPWTLHSNFIDEAQGGAADLIFVHADSVYDNRAVVLNDGELVLGEGVLQTIPFRESLSHCHCPVPRTVPTARSCRTRWVQLSLWRTTTCLPDLT